MHHHSTLPFPLPLQLRPLIFLFPVYVVGGFGVVWGLLSFLAYNQQQLQKDMGERMAQLEVDLVREMGEHKVDVLRAMGELKVDFVREMGEMKVDLFRETGEMKVLLMQQGMTRLEKPVSTRSGPSFFLSAFMCMLTALSSLSRRRVPFSAFSSLDLNLNFSRVCLPLLRSSQHLFPTDLPLPLQHQHSSFLPLPLPVPPPLLVHKILYPFLFSPFSLLSPLPASSYTPLCPSSPPSHPHSYPHSLSLVLPSFPSSFFPVVSPT